MVDTLFVCNASRTPHIAKEVESEFIFNGQVASEWWQATRAIAGEGNLVKLISVMVAAVGSCVAVLAALIKSLPPFLGLVFNTNNTISATGILAGVRAT